MKEYCVDLEIAKELKINGFPQINRSYYARVNNDVEEFEKLEIEHAKYAEEFCGIDTQKELDYQGVILFPTSDEILKELPREIKDLNFKYYYHLTIEKSPIYDEMYFISYGITNQDRAWMEKYRTNDKKLSNALANMWLQLKKEGYIK